MDLDFDHGFIPRIGAHNYKAVDRCLGPDSLFDAPLNMPWAIVDAPWAEKNQDFLASLRAQGTQTLLDGAWWRYRYSPTFDVRTMATASWAPEGPLSAARPERLARAVREFLRAQAKLDPSAYLLPGFMPDDKLEDLRPVYEVITAVARDFDDLPPKAFILFVGAHSEGLEAVGRSFDAKRVAEMRSVAAVSDLLGAADWHAIASSRAMTISRGRESTVCARASPRPKRSLGSRRTCACPR